MLASGSIVATSVPFCLRMLSMDMRHLLSCLLSSRLGLQARALNTLEIEDLESGSKSQIRLAAALVSLRQACSTRRLHAQLRAVGQSRRRKRDAAVQYDVVRLAPVARIADTPLWIVVEESGQRPPGLIAWLKANPGKASAATVGAGSGAHLGEVYSRT